MDIITASIEIGILLLIIGLLLSGIRIIRPTDRGLIERLGKYKRFGNAGFTYLIPFIDKLIRVNITEQMVNIDTQQIITNDNLNATVAAQVYFKIKPDEQQVKNSQYKVYNVGLQIVALAQTTLRNIIGTLTLTSANTERDKINQELMKTLQKETGHWGIQVVRTELKEIDPPEDVQETMNNVVKAENEKIAAKDYATATETKADGERRATIKEAEGERRAIILTAEANKQEKILDGEGRAKRIQLIYDASNTHFIGNAQTLRKLETVETSLKNNSVVYLPEGESLINVVGGLTGDQPVVIPKKEKRVPENKEEPKKSKRGRGQRGTR